MIEISIDIIKSNVRKILVFCIFVCLAGYFVYNSERLSAQEQENGDPNYPATGNVRLGTWNEGQAAFWDLDFLEHFRYFGPEQRLKGYRPEQPIKFSHVTHVQKNKTDCQFCHWSVAKAAYAAIPEEENLLTHLMLIHVLLKILQMEKITPISLELLIGIFKLFLKTFQNYMMQQLS